MKLILVICLVEAHRPRRLSVVEHSETDVQEVGDAIDKCQALRMKKRGFRIEQDIGDLDGWAGQGQAGAFDNAGQGYSMGWILRSSPLAPSWPLPWLTWAMKGSTRPKRSFVGTAGTGSSMPTWELVPFYCTRKCCTSPFFRHDGLRAHQLHFIALGGDRMFGAGRRAAGAAKEIRYQVGA